MAEMALREAYGRALAEYGETNLKVVVLDADTSSSTLASYFAKRFPERFFNVGIAEMNMAAMAAGLATTGKIPFINTFACFMVLRCGDPIRSLIAYSGLNVKIAGAYAGISDSYDGASHHSILDVAFMRALPNMTVLCPADGIECAKMVDALERHRGPAYVRVNRNDLPFVTPPEEPYHRLSARPLSPCPRSRTPSPKPPKLRDCCDRSLPRSWMTRAASTPGSLAKMASGPTGSGPATTA